MRPSFILWLVVMSGCSTVEFSRYWSPSACSTPLRRVALLPLWVTSATETKVSGSYGPGWITETRVELPLSLAEYKPAEALVHQALVERLQPVAVLSPDELQRAVGADTFQRLEEAIPELARRTGVDGLLVMRVRDFVAMPVGLENASARGQVDLTLYEAAGQPRWSLAAAVYKSNVGVSNAAPSLAQFMDYVMGQMGRELEGMRCPAS